MKMQSITTKRPDLSIIIPAYNEERRIVRTLEQLDDFLTTYRSEGPPAATLNYEIVVVDDGSTDRTVTVVNGLASERPAIRCIRTSPNLGKGSAVRTGMLAVTGRVRVMYDADGSIPPEELPKIVEPVRSGQAAIAIGSRHVAGASVDNPPPWYRAGWSRLSNAVTRRLLVPGIYDTQCGFKAFSADAAEALFALAQIDGWSFDLEILALAHAEGLPVLEAAITWSDDPRSRISPLRDAVRGIQELIEIRRRLRG